MPPGFRPEVWRDTFSDFFSQQPGVIDYFDRYDQFAQEAGRGETIKLPALTLPASIPIVPGSVGSTHSPTDTGDSLVINKFVGHPIPVTPLDDRFNHPDYRNKLMRESARQIKNNSNTQALDLVSDAAVTQSVNTGGGALTDAVILQAKKLLDDAEWPAEDRYLFVTPDGENDLLSITTFTSSDFNPNAGEQNQQQVAWVRGFRLIKLPTARFKAVTTTRLCMAFHKNAIAAAVAQPHMKLVEQAGQFQTILETGALWGQKIVKADGIVKVIR